MDDSFEDSFEELSDEDLSEEDFDWRNNSSREHKEKVGLLKRMLNLFWKTRCFRNFS